MTQSTPDSGQPKATGSDSSPRVELPEYDLDCISETLEQLVAQLEETRATDPVAAAKVASQARAFIEQLGKLVAREDDLLNVRMGWMLTFQGFLITGLALSTKVDGVPWLWLPLAVLGVLSNLIFYYTLSTGTRALSIRTQEASFVRDRLLEGQLTLPVIGRRSPAALWVQLTPARRRELRAGVKLRQRALFWARHFFVAWRSIPIVLVVFWLLVGLASGGGLDDSGGGGQCGSASAAIQQPH